MMVRRGRANAAGATTAHRRGPEGARLRSGRRGRRARPRQALAKALSTPSYACARTGHRPVPHRLVPCALHTSQRNPALSFHCACSIAGASSSQVVHVAAIAAIIVHRPCSSTPPAPLSIERGYSPPHAAHRDGVTTLEPCPTREVPRRVHAPAGAERVGSEVLPTTLLRMHRRSTCSGVPGGWGVQHLDDELGRCSPASWLVYAGPPHCRNERSAELLDCSAVSATPPTTARSRRRSWSQAGSGPRCARPTGSPGRALQRAFISASPSPPSCSDLRRRHPARDRVRRPRRRSRAVPPIGSSGHSPRTPS